MQLNVKNNNQMDSLCHLLDRRHRNSTLSNINRASFMLSKKNASFLVPRRKESVLAEVPVLVILGSSKSFYQKSEQKIR